MMLQLIEESCLKGIPEKPVVEMSNGSPKAVIGEAAFGNEAVDMGIPF